MKHCDLFFLSFVLLLLCACDGRDTDYDASGVFEATEIIVSARALANCWLSGQRKDRP